ncbi:MAG: 5-bromo-4-chloroindolyl phosphate hydrolysis family protein [Butyrivibrio sp.]|uniref:5-bromo-4-chloroindolyl phosphate hydrolysis family protein n=1 Tax=Butyrivibrio sp. TaxID=28121 RepID=UPI0025CDD522|nr:5-bromo-4-chloroindolyl phosphate hydrolysis family protein [Butyrivibrio sp.]MCR5772885.1 5-bromo-4-chloroindolyl phosphate hydrolysis family protein [Butyrivibrio sp.]
MQIIIWIVVAIVVLAILASVLEWVFDHIIPILILAASIVGLILYPHIAIPIIGLGIVLFAVYILISKMVKAIKEKLKISEQEKKQREENINSEEAKKNEAINSLSEDVQEYVMTGKRYIDKFYTFSKTIKSEEIRVSLKKIIDILNKIVDAIIYHPKQARRVHKLFDYYLPTIDKVLSAYVQYDKTGVSGESVEKTKKEIEELMDDSYGAFKSCLELIYQDDTIDISSEVAAMKQVMEMDGLKESIKK